MFLLVIRTYFPYFIIVLVNANTNSQFSILVFMVKISLLKYYETFKHSCDFELYIVLTVDASNIHVGEDICRKLRSLRALSQKISNNLTHLRHNLVNTMCRLQCVCCGMIETSILATCTFST